MSRRYLLDFFIIIFFVFAPWWLCAAALIYGAFAFPSYYEFLFFSVLYDLVYGPSSWGVHNPIALTLGGAVVFLLIQLLKSNFNLHEKKFTR